MVQIEALRLFILDINDKRIDGNFGSTGTGHRIPQQGASEFAAMVGEGDGKATQARDGNGRITRQTFGKPGWHLRQEYPARGKCVEPGNAIRCDLAGDKTHRGAAAHILAGLLPKIAIERIHAAGKLRTIVTWRKRLDGKWPRHREDAIKRA